MNYKLSYSSTLYKGIPFVEPPANGILINNPIIEGA